MIENIKKNIQSEMEILSEISIHFNQLINAEPAERQLLLQTINSLRESLKIINDSIPALLNEITLAKVLPFKKKKTKTNFEEVSYKRGESKLEIFVSRTDKGRLRKELSISEASLMKLKKKTKKYVEEVEEFKSSRGYLKLANKLFLKKSVIMIEKGKFKNLSKELRRSNVDILFQSYIAMILLSVTLSFIIGFFIAIFFLFFNLNFGWPMISLYSGNYFSRALRTFWAPFLIPALVFLSLYFYPSTEKKTLAKQINQELPFAVIHMSAISGSGIRPDEIFRIIGLSKEYPYLRKEIKKVLNQMNLYGYDLVTSLNNAASSSASVKLAELFTGLATTINSGGSFSDFFDKRAETLLVGYRLERQKYTKVAETFMDIYISIVIAAPMILMLFMILLTLGNFDVGLSTTQLTILIIATTTIINVFFLVFIHLNQPTY
jgi:uncharacterized membrane protein